MPSYASLGGLSQLWVNGLLGHVHCTGDSQATYTGNAPNNYWLSNGLVQAYPRRWDYFVAQTTNSSINVPSRCAVFGTSGSPNVMNNISSTRDIADFPTYGGVQFHETARIAYGADIAANDFLGSLCALNQQGVSGAIATTAFSWPYCQEHGLPWYHGGHMRASLVYWDLAGMIRKWALDFARVGASFDAAPVFQVDISGSGATNQLENTAWTNAWADADTYNLVGGANYRNDHEARLRLFASSDAGYNENTLSLLPMSAIFARSDSGGVFTKQTDNSRLGFSCSGRAGSFVSDWLTYATQAQWQNYFSRMAVLQSQAATTRRFTLISMFGHNASGTELTGGAYTTTFRDNWIALLNRQTAAIKAQWSDAQVNHLVICPWRSQESGQNNSDALSRSLHGRVLEVASAVGADWFSFAELHGHKPFMYPLHPQSYGAGARLAAQLDKAMSTRTTFLRGRGR
jgi:hypothetical protein